jgi:hypothetical protein
MSIEEYMAIDSLIKYGVQLVIVLLLMGCHDWLLSINKANPFKRSVIDLTKFQWINYLWLFFGGTVLSMYVVAQPLELDEWVVVGVTSVLSFFVLYTFKTLLTTMRVDKLSFKLLVSQDFLLAAYLIILIELVFLNWFKEITIYVQAQFLVFVILYSVLIIVIGILLGIPKKNGGGKRLPDDWRLKAVIVSIIILDPIIVVLWVSLLVQIALEIILYIQ